MTAISITCQDFPNICRICLNTTDNLYNFIESKMIDIFKLLTNIEVC